MRKLIIVVASLLVIVLFIFQGFQQTFPLPMSEKNELTSSSGQGINDALDSIYYNVTIMGLKEATAESLSKDFAVDESTFSEVYGRYSDGRFGVADVIIVRPASGKQAEAREVLTAIRTSRTNLFQNYNIYGASNIAANAVIYARGDYLVLLMIDNVEAVHSQLNESIPA